MKKNNLETKTFKAGEIIYSHNDPAEFIFLIHSGKVRIDRVDHLGIYNAEQNRHTHRLRVIKKII